MQIIELTPDDNALAGKIAPDAKAIVFLCNTTNEDFTVDLLDPSTVQGVQIIIKNIGGNTLTVDGGQFFIDAATTKTLAQWERVSLCTYFDAYYIID